MHGSRWEESGLGLMFQLLLFKDMLLPTDRRATHSAQQPCLEHRVLLNHEDQLGIRLRRRQD